MNSRFLILMALLGLPSLGYGQNPFGLLHDGHHIVSVGIHANPSLNANADYLFAFEQKDGTFQRFGLMTQANFPLFSQQGIDFDFRIGAGALVGIASNFKALMLLTWNFSRTADVNGQYFHTGLKIDVLPGYYGTNWAFAPHLSLTYQPFIHIEHSEYAKQAFQNLYPSGSGSFTAPKNGWFYQTHLMIQTGVSVAYFQSTWSLNLTAGFQHQPNRFGLLLFPDLGMLPFYGGLNFGYSIVAP